MTSSYYAGKAAIVTGGAAGIGLALSEALLAGNARGVTLIDLDADALARETARLDTLAPGRVSGAVGDVTDEHQVARLIEEAAAARGGLDLLVLNAGGAFAGAFDEQANADWARAFALNFDGPRFAIRAALPHFRAQGGGQVVSIVSGIAFAPMAYQAMYAATKAALNALTLALRYEFWDENIRFSAATPGTTSTGIWQGAAPAHAQSPADAARAILHGVAHNERLVLGDQHDVSGATNAFAPAAAGGMDEYLLDVPRRRRAGKVAV